MTTQQREQEHVEGHRRERLEALISATVLRALGRPDDLRSVRVRWLWDHYYRVNVLTGDGVATPVIAHSYFLTTDGAGEILDASPAITRTY